jgi:hypothetical protein
MDQKAVVASYYGMSNKADYYRTRAEECCLKATIAEDIDRRSHWLEAAARWLSFGRQESAMLSQRPTSIAKQVERSTANISGLLVTQCSQAYDSGTRLVKHLS